MDKTLPIFEVIDGDKKYEIYLNGEIKGFGKHAAIVNRIPENLARKVITKRGDIVQSKKERKSEFLRVTHAMIGYRKLDGFSYDHLTEALKIPRFLLDQYLNGDLDMSEDMRVKVVNILDTAVGMGGPSRTLLEYVIWRDSEVGIPVSVKYFPEVHSPNDG